MQHSADSGRGAKDARRTSGTGFRGARGFTYMALLVTITIIGVTLGVAGKYWRNVMLRDKEEELLFRGDEYRRAIEKYYFATPGRLQWPSNIEQLLKDDRFPQAKRHLRRKYQDPITGEDFVLIKDAALGNRIVGVKSSSEKEPLKKSGFPPLYKDFENKEKYNEWEFRYQPQQSVPAPSTPAPRVSLPAGGAGQPQKNKSSFGN